MGRRIGRLWGGGSAGCGEEDLQSGLFYENKDRFSRSIYILQQNTTIVRYLGLNTQYTHSILPTLKRMGHS